MLAEDVTVWVDGGGRVGAARRPIHGADRVARYLTGSLRLAGHRVRLTVAEVNGAPGLLAFREATLVGVLALEAAGDRISGMRIVANPDKLRLSHSGRPSGS